MPKKLDLHDILKVSYETNKQAKRDMKKMGYYLDKKLSSGHEKVFYSPYEQKLLMTVAGSRGKKDWIVNNPLLAGGKLHHTDRYKEAHDRLIAAKKKYGDKISYTIAGHSLGGGIASSLGNSNDKIYTYNKGAPVFSKHRDNETSIRTRGDVVSMFASDPLHNTTLDNFKDPVQNELGFTGNILHHGLEGFHGLLNGSIKTVYNAGHTLIKDIYGAHDVDNLKNEPIFL